MKKKQNKKQVAKFYEKLRKLLAYSEWKRTRSFIGNWIPQS